jgi:hypothetical protein
MKKIMNKIIISAAVFSIIICQGIAGSSEKNNNQVEDTHIVIIAAGKAPIISGDDKSAKEAAIIAAMHTALEEGIGLYITSRVHVQNLVLIQSIIVKQVGGLAAVKKIISEGSDNGFYSIKAEIWVSRMPLIALLRQNGILREWRVMVVLPEYHIQRPIPDPAAETEITRQFIEAGYKVVDRSAYQEIRNSTPSFFKDNKKGITLAKKKGADILITGEAFSERAGDASGRLMSGLVACNARIEVKAVMVDTAEVIFSDGYNTTVPVLHTSESVAAKKALQGAAEEFAGKIIAAVSRRPALLSGPKLIEAGPFPDIRTAVLFEKQIRRLPGVQKVHREQYDDGNLVLEVDVIAGESDNLESNIEAKTSLPGYNVAVEGASRSVIRVMIRKK